MVAYGSGPKFPTLINTSGSYYWKMELQFTTPSLIDPAGRKNMRVKYFPDTDTAHVEFKHNIAQVFVYNKIYRFIYDFIQNVVLTIAPNPVF
jgi:hypothetical protein